MNKKTVTINGRVYDAITGLALPSSAPTQPSQAPRASHQVHHTVQRSRTLKRQIVTTHTPQAAPVAAPKQPVVRSQAIRRFASDITPVKSPHRPTTHAQNATPVNKDIAHTPHPMAARVHHTQQQKKQAALVKATHAPKPSQVIKNEAIADALAKAPTSKQLHDNHHKQKRQLARKFSGVLTAGVALVMLGGYLTYINMPNLMVRVAAANAGINASYPNYKPDGYTLSGPVASTSGEVSLKFASTGGPQHFTISQAQSNWDSSSVLDNYVKKEAGENYTTYNERGLTLFMFDSNAAWVNGGILYTISGDAPLNSDQIRRIATSM